MMVIQHDSPFRPRQMEDFTARVCTHTKPAHTVLAGATSKESSVCLISAATINSLGNLHQVNSTSLPFQTPFYGNTSYIPYDKTIKPQNLGRCLLSMHMKTFNHLMKSLSGMYIAQQQGGKSSEILVSPIRRSNGLKQGCGMASSATHCQPSHLWGSISFASVFCVNEVKHGRSALCQ